ncbi:hypothetical protein [Luteimonas suaedae]|uniref:hypothetical protein n=1 Tax=Luteimonas suaedae TaxID=2605430 RepID=UPI0011ECC8A2|nr:hypothetical protein [Luteimonas suaedae]
MTKAGSTAIQNYLEKCRNELRTHGVLFPETGFARGNPFDPERTSGHLELVRQIRRRGVQPLEDELKQANARVVVLSAENLLLDRPDDELRALAEYFHGWEVTVIVILRSQQEWLRSRYVESVLSGFKASIGTVQEFTAEAAEKGWLNYYAALERVCRLVSADEVRLINYEEAALKGRLVEEFLRVADLPLTDAALARTIRANVREKDVLLVEAKRRLNPLLRRWSRDARLAYEAEFREIAKEVEKRLPDPAQYVKQDWLPLSETDCLEISATNLELERVYGLVPPLRTPVSAAGYTYQHRDSRKGLDELVIAGWKLGAMLGQRADVHEEARGAEVSSALVSKGIDRVINLLVSAQVSLHIGSADTALIAASMSSKLLALVPLGSCCPGEALDVLRVRLPSEIICLKSSLSKGSVLSESGVLCGRRLEVVVARGTDAMELVSGVFMGGFTCTVILIGCELTCIPDFISRFSLEVASSEDDCIILIPGAGRDTKRVQ